MPETHSNPLDDPTANPFEVAAQAAADIARLTGVEKHDIALTLGSGWGRAADIIGETVAMGLDNDWLVRAIKAVGNYGEIYERNIGPLNIPRGLNNLWNKGGVMYAPPIR